MNKFMAYFVVLAALVLSGALPSAAQQPARRIVLLDRIVAVVNEDVITRRDLDDRLKAVTAQMRQQGTPLPPAEGAALFVQRAEAANPNLR